MFLDGHGEVGAALDRGVVGDDQALAPRHAPDAGDDARAGRVAVVQIPRRQRRQFQKGRAGIEQAVDALAHKELALLGVTTLRLVAAAAPHLRQPGAQLLRQPAMIGGVGGKL